MSSEGPNDLGDRIARAQAARAEREEAKRPKEPSETGSLSAGAYALRYGAEFAANVFVGGFFGYWVDEFAGSKPWGLLIGGTIGFVAAIRAIMRAYRELNAQAQKMMEGQSAPENGKTDE